MSLLSNTRLRSKLLALGTFAAFSALSAAPALADHPHGGGEGRAKGNHPQSPWGQPAKGYRTRRNHASDKYIVARRKKR